MRRRSLAFLLFTALAAPATAHAADGDIIVRRQAGLDRSERAELRARADVRLQAALPLPSTELVTPEGGVQAALAALRSDPEVVYAEPDLPVHALTNDASWGELWGLENSGQPIEAPYDGSFTFRSGVTDADIDAPEAWQRTRGAGVTVAVVDTGVNAAHEDLAGQVVASLGHDWVDGGAPDDANGHGSHVAGTIAALADNGYGVAGVAPEAKVVALRVLNASGIGSLSNVAEAFVYAAEHGVRIVNASLGGSEPSYTLERAIADNPGTLFVVAAGNDGISVDVTAEYPCTYPYANLICVGASDNSDRPAYFSNFGPVNVDLFAPGMGILSTYMASGPAYVVRDGTSMASPHVAGAAALALAANPTASTAQLRAALLGAVDHPTTLAGFSATGGRLNADAAVQAVAAMTPEPTPTPVPPAPTPTPAAPATTPAPTPAPAALTSVTVSGSLRTKASRLRVRFSLTRAAAVRFTVTRRGSTKALATWLRDGAAGRNVVSLSRRLPTRRTLKPGAYTLSLRLASSARSASFRVP